MAVNVARYTKLEAVNDILLTIGEDPVSSLSSGLAEAELAESILDRSSREIQSHGWHCNTRRGITVTRNGNNIFNAAVNWMRVDTVNPVGFRRSSNGTYSKHYNVGVRRSSDDTQFVLYDLDLDSETWASGPSTLTITVVEFLDFENLTTGLQQLILKHAGRRFQRGAMQSRVLDAFTNADLQEAWTLALQEDMVLDDTNMFKDNADAASIARRYNPTWGGQ